MKNTGLFLFGFVALLTIGCEKTYQGDSYDFSDSKVPYVEFSSKKAVVTVQGSTIISSVQMRTALTEEVTVNYEVSGTTTTIAGSVVIPRNTIKGSLSIKIPAGIVDSGSVVQAQLKLVSALKGTESLRIGSNDPSTEIIALTIKP